VVAASDTQRERLWHLSPQRDEANKREGMGLTHDIAVPVYRIPAFVEQAGAMLQRRYPGVQSSSSATSATATCTTSG
jgi:D-lactate dehydrogenase (cytochrome)